MRNVIESDHWSKTAITILNSMLISIQVILYTLHQILDPLVLMGYWSVKRRHFQSTSLSEPPLRSFDREPIQRLLRDF